MMTPKIILMACGSFSPPTPMHLRMFEIAKDFFHDSGTHTVIGGVISPVHDSYGKAGLAAAKHRCAMIKLALKSSSWIRMSDWECNSQDKWTTTRQSLQYHQNYTNSYINDVNFSANQQIPGWLPENIKQMHGPIQFKLICGADLLESFSVPGLWAQQDIEAILGQHGIVVVSRSGSNPEKYIFESDMLSKFRKNITIVTNWIANEVSSTIIRRFVRRGLSVKYLLDDTIIDYIQKNELFGAPIEEKTKYILTPNHNDHNDIDLTLTEADNYINDNDIEKLNLTNNLHSSEMDVTDFSSKHEVKLPEIINDKELPLRSKIFCCGSGESLNVKSILSPLKRQTVSIMTHHTGNHTINHEHERDDIEEVGETQLSTLVLTPTKNALLESKKIEFLSDNHLNRIGTDDDCSGIGFNKTDSSSFDRLSDVGMPTTSLRNQNDLIKFVFTSHGIRVISDKEYVV